MNRESPFYNVCIFSVYLIVITSVCVRRQICTVLAEQVQRGFICSRTSVLVEPSREPSPRISSGSVLLQHYVFRRSIKQQQVLLVDKAAICVLFMPSVAPLM